MGVMLRNGNTSHFLKAKTNSNLFFGDARQIRHDNIAYTRNCQENMAKPRGLKHTKLLAILLR